MPKTELNVLKKQPKRGRLWLNDGSYVRLGPCRKNHVCSYDLAAEPMHDSKSFRMLTLTDEFTREYLAIVVARNLRSDYVLACLTELFKSRQAVNQ